MTRFKQLLYCLLTWLLPTTAMAGPLFDAHLHYNAEYSAHYSPQQVVQILDRNGVTHAVVTATPAQHAAALYHAAPGRIVPLLGVYRNHADKIPWPHDTGLPARVEAELGKGFWQGIGELHIFAADRHSPVFRRIVALAVQHELPLLLHADPAVIDSVYDIAPGHPVVWAHAGTFPYPDLVADYLQRYPSLYIDVAVRDGRIAPGGIISDDWYELFLRFPGRVMVGVDTYHVSRWRDYDAAVATIREWLAQLPDDIAARLAHDNAAALYGKRPANGRD